MTERTLKFENAGHFFGGKETVEIGIDSFSAKVLCDKHNNALSPLDSAAGRAFERFDCLSKEIIGTLQRNERHQNLHLVSGVDFERWMIKVYCGLVAAGKIKSASGKPIGKNDVPEVFYQSLIAPVILPSPLGLYMHSYAGQQRQTSGLSFGTIKITDGSDGVGGLMLSLGMMNFVLIASTDFGVGFSESTWYRHQEVAANIRQRGSRLALLFTY